MRNLKRALSLALASVMLLGMMVVGTSAANFADADAVVNKEAVEIVSGLKIMEGTTDGKFNPTSNVTRAEMATIIVKMLHGSTIDANQFKGAGTFSDTVSYQGGWAEGYISLCSSMGIVKGYGDGTFKPEKEVTTAEAVTMIINALKVDAGAGTWPMTVMAKAEEIDLFEDLAVKPGTNLALTRDQLASIVVRGMKYSPSNQSGYTVVGVEDTEGDLIVFENMTDAVNAAINMYKTGSTPVSLSGIVNPVPATDSLLKTVFNSTPVAGFVSENQETQALDRTKAVGVDVDLETGLDMIGHYVDLYYSEKWTSDEKPGVAYCIVDKADYLVVEKDILAVAPATQGSKKDFQAIFGTSTTLDFDPTGVNYVDGNYVTTPKTDAEMDILTSFSTANYTAKAGTYVVFEGIIKGYIAPAATKVGKVSTVTTTAGLEKISVGNRVWENNATTDEISEYEGIAKGDIVTYNLIGSASAATANKIVVKKANVIEGKVEKTFTKDTVYNITVGGVDYPQADALAVGTVPGLSTSAITNFDTTYTVYLTEKGEFFGYEAAESAANLSNVYYVKAVYDIEGTNAYDKKSATTYAQVVDMEGKESQIVLGIWYDFVQDPVTQAWSKNPAGTNADNVAVTGALASFSTPGLYTFTQVPGIAASKIGAMTGTALTDTYDADEKNIFATTMTASVGTPVKFDSKTPGYTVATKEMVGDPAVATPGTAYAFVGANTKFILINGAAQTALTTAVTTGTITKSLTANAPVILSKDARGNVMIEAVIIDNLTSLSVSSEDTIYVSAEQIANEAVVGTNKYQYNAYFLADGTVKPIVLASQLTALNAGFYTYDYNETDALYTLNSGSFNTANVTFASFYGESTLIASGASFPAKGIEAGKAQVYDIRGTKAIEDHLTCNYAITDLATLEMAAAEHTVTMTILLDDAIADAENVLAIFITGATYKY